MKETNRKVKKGRQRLNREFRVTNEKWSSWRPRGHRLMAAYLRLAMGITNRSDLSGSPKSRAWLPEFFLVQVRLLLLQGEVSPQGLAVKMRQDPGESTELGPPVHLLRESVRPF